MRLVGRNIVARVALAMFALSGTLAAIKVANPGQAHASSNNAFASVNYVVDGPLLLHPDSPTVHSSVTDLIPTNGEFDIQCFVLGDNVNGDNAWDYGVNPVTGDTGYMSDYYLDTNDTQGNEANQLPQEGIPLCGGENQQNVATTPTSVFFSPIPGVANALPLLPNVAEIQYDLNAWSSGDCSDTKVRQILSTLPTTVNTLAGWSRGRMGPIYVLEAATAAQLEQIHTIILFDPGNLSDMEPVPLWKVAAYKAENKPVPVTCDWQYNPSQLLTDWLQSDPQQNRLIVYTGLDSEMKALAPGGGNTTAQTLTSGTAMNASQQNIVSTYAGLWQYYFAGVWNTTTGAQQVLVCDYDNLGHEDVLRDFYTAVQKPPRSCQQAPDQASPLTQWTP